VEFPQDLLYSTEDEWLRREDGEATIGITDFAQDQLGDVVYLELPEPGTPVAKGEPFGIIESVKAVSDLYAPASGEVIERNERLVESPELVNQSPYGEAWMIRLRLSDASELDALLSAEAYEARLPKE
jgi:glycine cleavage system H protein